MSGLSPGVTSLSGVPYAQYSNFYSTYQKDLMIEEGSVLLPGSLVEALGSTGLADMLWALAVLGGVADFQEEMDAVLEVSAKLFAYH